MMTAVHVIDVRLARPSRGTASRLIGGLTAFMRWTAVRLRDLAAGGQLGPDWERTIGRASGARV